MQALESPSPLIVYIDVKSPYAFVAIEPTLALENTLAVQFDWRPLTLDIPSFLGSARKTDDGKIVENKRSSTQWGAVKYAYMDARRYAQRQGYKLMGTQKIWDSSIANIAILWVAQTAREKMHGYLSTVFPPFWRRELDIEDVNVVCNTLESAGISAQGFAEYSENEGRQAHDQLQQQLHPANIYGVPTYVIDHQILFGREHLPYVEWLLRGKQGMPPDIAYSL